MFFTTLYLYHFCMRSTCSYADYFINGTHSYTTLRKLLQNWCLIHDSSLDRQTENTSDLESPIFSFG